MSNEKRLSPVRTAMCAILSLLLTAMLLATCALGLAAALLHSRELHESVALSETVLDAQMQRITDGVTALSEQYPFDPAPVLAMIDRESIVALNRDTITWWMAMAQGRTEEWPVWQGGDVAEIIRNDERFLEQMPVGLQKATARDKIAPAIEKVISEAVLPVRTALVSIGANAVLSKLPVERIAKLVLAAPGVTLLLSLMLEGLILLLCRKRPRSKALWGAAPLSACAIVVAVLDVLILQLNIPGRISVMSPYAAIQVEALLQRLYLGMYSVAGGCALIAACWTWAALRKARRMEEKRLGA